MIFKLFLDSSYCRSTASGNVSKSGRSWRAKAWAEILREVVGSRFIMCLTDGQTLDIRPRCIVYTTRIMSLEIETPVI